VAGNLSRFVLELAGGQAAANALRLGNQLEWWRRTGIAYSEIGRVTRPWRRALPRLAWTVVHTLEFLHSFNENLGQNDKNVQRVLWVQWACGSVRCLSSMT